MPLRKLRGIFAGFLLTCILVAARLGYSAISSVPHWTMKTRLDFRGISQVLVPAGCFNMGSDAFVSQADEQPVHKVCLSHDYWIDQYEVTNESYQKFVDDGGYTKPQYWSAEGWQWLEKNHIKGPEVFVKSLSQPKQARIGINWFEANAYANWRGGRLPTEAEWEYAARGPDSFTYPSGNQWDDTWLSNNTDQSWIGAYNMGCNALEWASDWYSSNYYALSPTNNPLGPTIGELRVLRGGQWDGAPGCTYAATRHGGDPYDRGDYRGTRILSDN